MHLLAVFTVVCVVLVTISLYQLLVVERYIKEKGNMGAMFSKIKRYILNIDEDLENLVWLISVIDSYRVGMGVDLEGVRQRVRKLRGPLRMENWPQIYKDMEEIRDLPYRKEPRLRSYVNLFVILRFAGKQAFLIVGVVLIVFLLSLRMPFGFTTRHVQYFLYGIIGLWGAVVMVRTFVRDKMKVFYYHHQKDYKKNEQRLHKATQDLIYKMGKLLEEKGANPKRYRFSVYQKDYNGITILKKPGGLLLRDFYVVAAKKR